MSDTLTIDDQLDRIRIDLTARRNELQTLIEYSYEAIPATLRRKYVTACGGLSDAIRLLGEKE